MSHRVNDNKQPLPDLPDSNKVATSEATSAAISNRATASLWQVFKRSAGYEGRFLLHHSWDYVMLLWLPLLTILGVWWTFSKPYITDLPIGVIDQSHSSYSRLLVRYLDASPDVQVTGLYPSLTAAKTAIVDYNIYGVVIIPSDFADNISQGKPAPVVFKVNAQYGSHSGIAQRGVQTAVGTLSAGVEIGRSVKQGSQRQQATITYSPIAIERISLFNAGGNYQQFLASTVMPALLHILMMIIGATTIGRELRDRTLAVWYTTITDPTAPYPNFAALKKVPPEQKLDYLHNEPLAKPHIPPHVSLAALVVGLNGKLIWALLFYALWGALMLTLANGVHASSLPALAIVFVAFVALTMISLWLGAIFCLLSYSLRMGLSSAAFISAPSYAFAGVAFPLLSMSEGAQRWAHTLPLTHYLKIHIGQLQMLAPLSTAYHTLFGLIVAVLVLLVLTALLCIRAFKNPQRWGSR